MRVVLYTNDMEPITVISLPAVAEEYLKTRGMAVIPVLLPPLVVAQQDKPAYECGFRTVTIVAEIFIRRGRKHTFLFTHDDESALLLKSAFLPGQVAELQNRERSAFAKGFVAAVTALGSD